MKVVVCCFGGEVVKRRKEVLEVWVVVAAENGKRVEHSKVSTNSSIEFLLNGGTAIRWGGGDGNSGAEVGVSESQIRLHSRETNIAEEMKIIQIYFFR